MSTAKPLGVRTTLADQSGGDTGSPLDVDWLLHSKRGMKNDIEEAEYGTVTVLHKILLCFN